ncbi:MAG: type II secretion system GspH family protein [Pseudomonadales bacterium]|nr:type II secretion system GspH family protein [Pseudomonadales bacterium]
MNSGFTLLELLMVVSILSSVAYLAMDNIASSDAQNKWELTKIRLQAIERAIIGDSSRVHNGRSELSGFVVDMGRLPKCIAELLMPESCSGDALPEYSLFDNNLSGGWNGPYLYATHQTNGAAFRDGWGNKGDIPGDGSVNFGWDFKIEDVDVNVNFEALVVQSKGLDRTNNPSLLDEYNKLSVYERDYPPTLHTGGNYMVDPAPLIRTNQYRQPVTQYNSGTLEYTGAVLLDLGVLSACENAAAEFDGGACVPVTVTAYFEYVCLKISSIDEGLLNEDALVSTNEVKLTLDGTRQLLAFQFGETADAFLLKGRHVASLHLRNASGCINDTVDFNASFDGISDGSSGDDDVLKVSFIVLPGRSLDILDGSL